MLDNPAWNPRHVPGSLVWIHRESITFIGDIMVAIIMEILNISPQRLMAHIRKIYATELAFLQHLNCIETAPPFGSLVGDEPPPPPRTKVDYYFQLNTKYGLALQRA